MLGQAQWRPELATQIEVAQDGQNGHDPDLKVIGDPVLHRHRQGCEDRGQADLPLPAPPRVGSGPESPCVGGASWKLAPKLGTPITASVIGAAPTALSVFPLASLFPCLTRPHRPVSAFSAQSAPAPPRARADAVRPGTGGPRRRSRARTSRTGPRAQGST